MPSSPPKLSKRTPTNAIRVQRDLSAIAAWHESYRQSHKSRPLRVVTGSQSATALPPSCKLYARVSLKQLQHAVSFLCTLELGHGLVLDFLLTSHCGNVTFIGLCLFFVYLVIFFLVFCFLSLFAILRSLLKLFVSCLWHLSCYLFSLLCLLFHKPTPPKLQPTPVQVFGFVQAHGSRISRSVFLNAPLRLSKRLSVE